MTCHIFCHIFTYKNEQNTSSHSQSAQKPTILISNPELCHHRKSYRISCKQENCLKIGQCCIKNNISLEASCKHYGVRKRYYTCWKMQLILLPDDIVWNVQKIHFSQLGSLLPITDELL